MVATDMYGKSPYGSGYTKLCKIMTFLPFLFSFLFFIFYNACYIFILHPCSTSLWDFILMLICLDIGATFLFVIVIILFIYDSGRYGTVAISGEQLFMTTIYGFQSLRFEVGGFVWDILAVPDPPFLYSFSVTNIMVWLEF